LLNRTKDHIFGSYFRFMKKEKKITDANTQDHILSEPIMPYAVPPETLGARTINLMGMAGKMTAGSVRNDNDLIDIIRAGIPKQAMTHFMDVANLTMLEMAAIIHTTDRTLRRYQPQQKLPQEQSERMVEMARLYTRGAEVFHGMGKFIKWMETNILPLGNKKPKEYLDTSIGINLLMDELGRIEHGVFA
jgi:putative toxin-antitoxin system antitoxin component (TIGR02293 family)